MARVGELVREKRRQSGYTQKELGDIIGINQSGLARIENGVMEPSRQHVANIAKHLSAPELLATYCEACPVCTALLPVQFPDLNNVPLHPTTVVHKGAEEAREAADAFEELFRVFDRLDWAEDEDTRGLVVNLLVQIRDVEVAIRILYQVLFVSGLLPIDVLEEVNRRQEQKCIERGYCKPNGTEG